MEVSFKGKTILQLSKNDYIIHAGSSATWEKEYNFGKQQQQATARAFCKKSLTPEEKSAKQDSLFKALFAVFVILLFITFMLPHRNDSTIREMEKRLG